ncbi:hypothetical protein DFH09DRAFT_1091398 [Mycena vulgaris]|nr:hypothetical protein DFH09DRAFT_1091398 [Mycena vulgaris]
MSSFYPNLTIGAMKVGMLVSYVLFGVTTTQAYIYYGRFPEDSWRLKLLARLASTLTWMKCTADEKTRWLSFGSASTPSASDTRYIQGFFALRIYRLSKLLYILWLSWTLSLPRLICGLAAFVYGLRMVTFRHFEAQSQRLLATAWSVSAANEHRSEVN